jgi:CelD/BcsL family acetyltransferase involved in cellulose biosynthesis
VEAGLKIHILDPLSDSRWDDLVARHPKASVFHERGWLEALARTYSYIPFVLTSAPAGEPVGDGIVFCRVPSWLTGNRVVSLPFADHCEPLVGDSGVPLEFTNWLREECVQQRWKYVELRPRFWKAGRDDGLRCSASYFLHSLDLTSSLEKIFGRLHKDSMQRRIRRAEREGLAYEVDGSQRLVDEFYGLLLKTRRRHQMIPQPVAWFRNLVEFMHNKIRIRVARKNSIPVAALLTLRHRSCVVYKYGCSDERFHHLAGMPFLFWRLIEESKAEGADEIDFGRSDVDNEGLVNFKQRFGTSRQALRYFRYFPAGQLDTASRWNSPTIRRLFSVLPDILLVPAGRILYRHIG